MHSKLYSAVYKFFYRLGVVKWLKKNIKWLTFTKIYPFYYNRARRKPVNPKKAVFIEVRHDYLTDNFKLLYDAMEKKGYENEVYYLQNILPGQKAYIERCIQMMDVIGDAKYIFLNDACDVISHVKIRKETVVTQVWHACGAFKKFGMGVADKIFGASGKEQLKYSGYKNLDYVTVSSPEIVWAYEEAMNLKPEDHIVRPVGVSRTDIFFDEGFKKRAYDRVKEVFPACEGKKIILYAPTFRGRVAKAKAPNKLDLGALKENFGDEYVVLIKHHPFVKNLPQIDEYYDNFAKDVTRELDIEDLLCVSDICISDYSSLVFEYSLYERPMIFFAYDLENYFDWRGFFYDYDELTPGPVVKTNKEIIDYIYQVKDHFDPSEVRAFRDKFMSSCDGHATEKILDLVLSTKK